MILSSNNNSETSRRTIGYKQYSEHHNEAITWKGPIAELSNISKSRYNPKLKKTASIYEFMKNPERYVFSVTTKQKEHSTFFTHYYYYDNKETAVKIHKELKVKLYDQLVEPYLKKIKRNYRLTATDQENILKILDNMDKLKVID